MMTAKHAMRDKKDISHAIQKTNKKTLTYG
jgi:hypothetical protein